MRKLIVSLALWATACGGSGGSSPADGAAPDVDGSANTYCQTLSPAPLFCADFDDANPLTQWDGQSASGGGTIDVSSDVAVSPPSSLVTTLPAANGQDFFPSAIVDKKFSAPLGSVTIAFDMYIESIDPTAQGIQLMALSLDATSPGYELFIELDGTTLTMGARMPDGAGSFHYSSYPGSASITQQQWMHVTIALSASSDGQTLQTGTVSFGNAAIPTFSIGSTAAAGNATLSIGSYVAAQLAAPCVVHYDNVTVAR